MMKSLQKQLIKALILALALLSLASCSAVLERKQRSLKGAIERCCISRRADVQLSKALMKFEGEKQIGPEFIQLALKSSQVSCPDCLLIVLDMLLGFDAKVDQESLFLALDLKLPEALSTLISAFSLSSQQVELGDVLCSLFDQLVSKSFVLSEDEFEALLLVLLKQGLVLEEDDLVECISSGSSSSVSVLLSCGAPISLSAFQEAISQGDLAALIFLLSSKEAAALTANLIEEAISSSVLSLEMVKLMMLAGVKPSRSDFLSACQAGKMDVAQLIKDQLGEEVEDLDLQVKLLLSPEFMSIFA